MTESAPLAPAARIRIPEHVLFQEVGGQAALLHLDTEIYYGLDEVGTEMWRLIEQDGRVDAVVAGMRERYDVDEATLRADLATLVRTLEGHALLVVE